MLVLPRRFLPSSEGVNASLSLPELVTEAAFVVDVLDEHWGVDQVGVLDCGLSGAEKSTGGEVGRFDASSSGREC